MQDAPPGGNPANGPGCSVYVVEVCGRLYDLITRDDDVGGEGTDGRVVPPSENAESSNLMLGTRMAARERCAYGASGLIGSLSHPRVGTRKTRLFRSSSRSSYAATTIPRNAHWVSGQLVLVTVDTHPHHLHLMCYRIRFQGTGPFESTAKAEPESS
jgi:hypothetical protein